MGIGTFEDLTGQKFGKLLVINRVDDYISPKGDKHTRWNCLCDCGNQCIINASALKSGGRTNCGCEKKQRHQEIAGQKFGHLTAIKRVEDKITPSGKKLVQYLCECDCENKTQIVVQKSNLINGHTKHCGCQPLIRNRTNLIGQKFGRLLVTELVGRKPKGNTSVMVWKCLCDCGNYKEASTNDLRSGHTMSCGCLFFDTIREKNKQNIKRNEYDLHTYDFGIGWTGNGTEFYFDKEDYDKIKNYTWNVNSLNYITAHDESTDNRRTIFMHRIVMEVNEEDWKKCQVDHINHNPFDNRKNNLRITKPSENGVNKRRQKSNTSGIPGVHWDNLTNKWVARINPSTNKRLVIGKFEDFTEAVKCRIESEIKYYGKFMFENNIKLLNYINDGNKIEPGNIQLIDSILYA